MQPVPPSSSPRSAWSRLIGRLPPWAYGFCLHVIAGGIATGAHYALMFVMLRTGLPAVAASTIGFGAGAITRFLLSYFHVFSPTEGMRTAMFRFVVALLIQMAANSLLLAGLIAVGWHVWVAQIATTLALTIFTYLGGKLWVFR